MYGQGFSRIFKGLGVFQKLEVWEVYLPVFSAFSTLYLKTYRCT